MRNACGELLFHGVWLAKHSGNSQEGSRDLADGEKPDAEDTGWAFQAKRGADNSPGVGKVLAAVRGRESLCDGRNSIPGGGNQEIGPLVGARAVWGDQTATGRRGKELFL